MAITLGSNIASLRGQRQLLKTSAEFGTVFQRLSSGQRINKASDDAAGLSIADSLNAQSRIFNQGVRNLNDGQSLLSIADSAIENLSDIVIRLEELAAQAANGVYTNKQRKAMDDEAQALSNEYYRISRSTEFNGRLLFDGSIQELFLQAGLSGLNLNVGGKLGSGAFTERSSFAVGGTSVLGNALTDLNGDGNLDLASVGSGGTGVLTIQLGDGNGGFSTVQTLSAPSANFESIAVADLNGDGVMDLVAGEQGAGSYFRTYLGSGNGTFSYVMSYSSTNLRDLEAGDFNGDGTMDLFVAGDTVVTLYRGLGEGTFSAFASFDPSFGNVNDVTVGDINLDGILDFIAGGASGYDVYLGTGGGGFALSQSTAIATILAMALGDINGDGNLDIFAGAQGGYGVALGNGDGTFAAPTVSVTGTNQNDVALVDLDADGKAEQITLNSTFLTIRTSDSSGGYTLTGIHPGGNTLSVGDINSDGVLDVVSGGGSASGTAQVLVGDTRFGIHPLLPFSLNTLADARQALPAFKRKREQLAAQRGEIGAFQSRIDAARNVLEVSSENFKAAESRIRDADIADESSRLVRLNILQQAASSVLAQANQQPVLALQLLGG